MLIVLELVIWCYLIGCLAGFVVWRSRAQSGGVLMKMAWTALLLGWVLVFYGSFIEPRRLVVREWDKTLEASGEGVARLVVFSDPHLGWWKGEHYLERVVRAVNAARPDAVLIPGDFILSATYQAQALRALAGLRMPTYAVLGNHDQEFGDADEIARVLEQAGVHVLRNTSQIISLPGGDMRVAGADDIWFTGKVSEALAAADTTHPTILLVHNPDAILEPELARANLVIAAHTHGGQIRLPWIGALAPIPTKLGRAFDRGWFALDHNRQLFITTGVGESGVRARLFVPPQVDVLTVRW